MISTAPLNIGQPRAITLPPRRLLAGLRWLVVAAASLLVLHEGVDATTLRCAVILGMLLGQETFTSWIAGRDLAPRWRGMLLLLDLAGVSAATIICMNSADYFFLLYPLFIVELTLFLPTPQVYLVTMGISFGYILTKMMGALFNQRTWNGLDWVLLGLEVAMFFIVAGVSAHILMAWRSRIDQISRLALLDELSLLLADTRQLDDVLASLVELVPTALAVQACVIAIDEPGSERRIWANLGADTDALLDEALLAQSTTATTAMGSTTVGPPYGAIYLLPLEIDERAVGFLSVARVTPHPFDVDDRRLFQSLARHAAQALRNARLYRLEAEAARESRQLEELKSEMLTGVSHEFRLPLTSISLATETLLNQHTLRGGDETEGRLLRNIQRSAARLGGFVQDLLDLARLDANQLQLRSRPLDIVQLVRHAAMHIEPACEIKQQRLRIESDLEVCLAQGDAQRLEQVISNLLTNAQQYTPEGGEIVLSVSRSAAMLQDHPCGESVGTAGAITIGVHDSGPGIPIEERATIFDRFSRGEAGRRRSSGAGLGLFIARSVVELHGGCLWVGDNSRGGSSFWCVLPLLPLEEDDAPPGTSASTTPAQIASYEGGH